MRIAVERVQPVDAAEHEAEDRLGREVAFGLRPLLDLGEARAVASSVVSTRAVESSSMTRGTWMNGWSA